MRPGACPSPRSCSCAWKAPLRLTPSVERTGCVPGPEGGIPLRPASRRSAPEARRMTREGLLLVLVLAAAASPVSASDIYIPTEVPDAIETVASARAIAIGYCYQGKERAGGWPAFSTRGAIHGRCA